MYANVIETQIAEMKVLSYKMSTEYRHIPSNYAMKTENNFWKDSLLKKNLVKIHKERQILVQRLLYILTWELQTTCR